MSENHSRTFFCVKLLEESFLQFKNEKNLEASKKDHYRFGPTEVLDNATESILLKCPKDNIITHGVI